MRARLDGEGLLERRVRREGGEGGPMGGSRFRGPRAKQDGGGSAGKNMADLNVMKKADVMSNGAADACDNGEKWSQEKTSNVKKKGSLMATLSRTFGKGGLKRADVKSKWKDYDETFTQVRAATRERIWRYPNCLLTHCV